MVLGHCFTNLNLVSFHFSRKNMVIYADTSLQGSDCPLRNKKEENAKSSMTTCEPVEVDSSCKLFDLQFLQLPSGFIKNGWLENTRFTGDSPIETTISTGFPSLPRWNRRVPFQKGKNTIQNLSKQTNPNTRQEKHMQNLPKKNPKTCQERKCRKPVKTKKNIKLHGTNC